MLIKEPNKPDAVNPAMALRFAIVHHWRRVTDLERWLQKLKATMQTKTIPLLGVLLSILGCVCACRPTTEPAAASPHSDDPDRLSQDAFETYTAYVKSYKPGSETPVGEIPSTYWTESLRALHPIRVYLHRANVVVVQEGAGESERGKYIQVRVSSYIPRSGDDGFEFTSKSRTGVHDFKRVRPL